MTKILIYILAFTTLTSLLLAQTPPNTSIKQFPPQSRVVAGVLVPVPNEIFNTFDKFANSNWRAVQHPELAQWRPHSDQADNALLLGVVIAEGFIAVEAEDAGEAKSIGRAVLALARGLGVEKAALRRSRSIVEAAEKGIAWMQLTASGRAGHGSMVNRENAVTRLADTVARAADRARALAAIVSAVDVLDYTDATAAHHARLIAHARRAGTPRGAHDLIIAAHAAETGRIILSRDAKARFGDLPHILAAQP